MHSSARFQHKRSTREILDSHLHFRKEHLVDEDAINYDPNLVILSHWGVFHGIEGMRRSATLLHSQLPNATYDYKTILVEGEVGFLEWPAQSATAEVHDGADSYIIRNGCIIAQTIHYTLIPKERKGK